MLDWLTGGPQSPSEPITPSTKAKIQAYDDAPETPAPMFAMRAFKHAIFGTPKPDETDEMRIKMLRRRTLPAQSKASTEETVAPTQLKGTKPDGCDTDDADILSPSKRPGILLTPGTERTRRKNVAFEPNGQPGKKGKAEPAPKDLPGKYPSPWLRDGLNKTEKHGPPKPSDGAKNAEKKDASETKLEVLPNPSWDNGEATVDMDVPRSASGRYWKTEFDSFQSKSTLELRKLAKKEQLAKKFAKHKDSEALRLGELLKREQKKVTQLEEQLLSQARVQSQSDSADEAAGKRKEAGSSAHERQRPSSSHSRSNHRRTSSASPSPVKADSDEIRTLRSTLRKTQAALDQANSRIKALQESNATLEASLKQVSTESEAAVRNYKKCENEPSQPQLRTTARKVSLSRSQQPKAITEGDIWADAVDGPSLLVKANPEKFTAAAREPLTQRDINSTEQQLREVTEKDLRLEAARRRLEEKRREREKNKATLAVA